LEFILIRKNFKVTTISSSQESAMDYLAVTHKNDPFDLVILDIKVPRSGLNMLDRIDRDIPKLVITAMGYKQLCRELLKRGCQYCLEKPFEESELLGCVYGSLYIEQQNSSMRVEN
jgi:DNA-binding response OmpR family regulator